MKEKLLFLKDILKHEDIKTLADKIGCAESTIIKYLSDKMPDVYYVKIIQNMIIDLSKEMVDRILEEQKAKAETL